MANRIIRKIIAFIFIAMSLMSSAYAQEWTSYNFQNLYSISIPSTLELRRDNDVYTQALNKIQESMPNVRITSPQNEIVFQQTGLSTNRAIYRSLYCRVLIDYYQCKDELLPCKGDTLELDEDFFMDTILAVNEENKVLGGGQVLKVLSAGAVTLAESPASELIYIREGMNGNSPVVVATYNIFNYDEYVRLTLSFRQNETELWEEDFKRIRDSFKWTTLHDNKKPRFDFTNIKGLTAADRAQWEKDNIEQLNKMNYSSLDESSKERAFKNAAFKNKFGNRSDYAQLKTLSPEKRDSLYMASYSEDIKIIKDGKTSMEYYLDNEDFYFKSSLIIFCGIIFILLLRTMAKRTSKQELSFSKKQKVTGSILMAIGVFSILCSIIEFISVSYPQNELTEYGYGLSNKYNDSIIRPASAKLIWGYNTPFLSGVISLLYSGICLLGWGIYVRNYQKSIIPIWKKVCKFIGYVLLTTTFYNCSEFHYFDIWEFTPKLILLALSILFIKIGSEKHSKINKHDLVSYEKIEKRKKTYNPISLLNSIFQNNIIWINKKAHGLYQYVKITTFLQIVIGCIIACCGEFWVGAGVFAVFEALIKNDLILSYLRKKATKEYSEDFLVPQWFKNKFYKYLSNKSGLRVILLFLYMPLFYIVPLPCGIFAIVLYIIPVCVLIGIYLAFKWIIAGKNESL